MSVDGEIAQRGQVGIRRLVAYPRDIRVLSGCSGHQDLRPILYVKEERACTIALALKLNQQHQL